MRRTGCAAVPEGPSSAEVPSAAGRTTGMDERTSSQSCREWRGGAERGRREQGGRGKKGARRRPASSFVSAATLKHSRPVSLSRSSSSVSFRILVCKILLASSPCGRETRKNTGREKTNEREKELECERRRRSWHQKQKKKRTWSMCLSSKPVRRAALWVFLHFEEPTPRLPTPPGFPPMDNKGLSEVLAKDNLFFWNQEKSCRKVKTLLSFFSTSSVFLLFFLTRTSNFTLSRSQFS